MKRHQKQTPDALEIALEECIQATRHAIKFISKFLIGLLKTRSSAPESEGQNLQFERVCQLWKVQIGRETGLSDWGNPSAKQIGFGRRHGKVENRNDKSGITDGRPSSEHTEPDKNENKEKWKICEKFVENRIRCFAEHHTESENTG